MNYISKALEIIRSEGKASTSFAKKTSNRI